MSRTSARARRGTPFTVTLDREEATLLRVALDCYAGALEATSWPGPLAIVAERELEQLRYLQARLSPHEPEGDQSGC